PVSPSPARSPPHDPRLRAQSSARSIGHLLDRQGQGADDRRLVAERLVDHAAFRVDRDPFRATRPDVEQLARRVELYEVLVFEVGATARRAGDENVTAG